MNRPADDPFSHVPTENTSYPPRPRPNGAPGYPQQPSSPGFPPQGTMGQPAQESVRQLDFPPLDNPFVQKPASQPGLAPQSSPSSQRSTSQPGFSSQPYSQQRPVAISEGQRPSSPENSLPPHGPNSSLEQTERNVPARDGNASLRVQKLPTVPLATVQVTPPPSSPKKAKKGSGVLVSIVVVLALIIAGGGTLFALHLRSTIQTRTTPTAQATPTTPVSTAPAVGSSGALNQPLQAGDNWVVTVTHVTTTTNSDFPPQAGYTYLEITLSLKNTSVTPQMVASLLQFTFSDVNGKKYNEAAAITKDTNIHQTPDGTVNAGRTLNAQLSYLVPQTQHTFTLSFAYDLIEGGSSTVTWQLNA